MKKILFLYFCVLLATKIFAQNSQTLDYIYCQLIKNDSKVWLTFGNMDDLLKDELFWDEKGKVRTFESDTDGVNYLGIKGWEVFQVLQKDYLTTTGTYSQTTIWILRKPFAKFSKEQQKIIQEFLYAGPLTDEQKKAIPPRRTVRKP